MNLEDRSREPGLGAHPKRAAPAPALDRKWFAVFTIPQNEKSVVKHLDVREIESFLPTFETVRLWKNRQRVKTILPLFPTYLFVHINSQERVKVLRAPGVVQIVGNGREGIPLGDAEIEFLRLGLCGKRIEPYQELVVGQKVRVRHGALQGLEGVLVKQKNSLRFVLSFNMIQQHAAVEVDAECLELLEY
jgi:transcription antitermination factor NusG